MLLLAHQVLSGRCISAFTHYILSNPIGSLIIIRTFKKEKKKSYLQYICKELVYHHIYALLFLKPK